MPPSMSSEAFVGRVLGSGGMHLTMLFVPLIFIRLQSVVFKHPNYVTVVFTLLFKKQTLDMRLVGRVASFKWQG